MKKFALLLLMLLLSNVANASVYNVMCRVGKNKIEYNYNGNYNHVWFMVNGVQRGDKWTISSGTGTFVTPTSSGDHVLVLWYNTTEGYGSADAICN